MPSAKIRKMLMEGELAPDDEKQFLELLANTEPKSLFLVCQVIANQKRQLRQELEKANKARAKAESELEGLRQPPWIPATVLASCGEDRVDVFGGGRRQIVTALPEVQTETLHCGDEVRLDHELALVVGRSPDSPRSGLVGTVSEMVDGRILLRGAGDEEMTVLCNAELAASLEPGHRVLYTREVPCVIGRIPERQQSRHVLEAPGSTRFEEVGGHENVISEIKRDLDLHMIHREQVAEYRLKMMRGVTLVGPPGVGKTLLAGAISRYVAEARPGTKFLHVKPGALRGSYYGESEDRIRELFAVIRAAPGFVIVFFEELDSYGARGEGIGQDIDGRVLGALLDALDGLDSVDNLMCIGATNRIDLCDPALVRQRRLGDRIYRLCRPGREATRKILQIYMPAGLPFANGEDPEHACESMIDALASYLYAPRGGAGSLATATLADSRQREITASDVLSGALLASAVESAKHVAAHRRIVDGDGAITLEDLIDSVDAALEAEAGKLTAPLAARRVLEIPHADEIVRVERPPGRSARRHRTVRAA
jgi:proteasome-associated ATPase